MLLRAYAAGIFPMAETKESRELLWFDPEERGIFPLDAFHVPRSLRKKIRKGLFDVRCDSAFTEVVNNCAKTTANRQETWINGEIFDLVGQLHQLGVAHSVECWKDGKLVGGLYGIALGGAFFGESMFSVATDASKVALVHLVARLRMGGYTLLDAQFITEHLQRFGAIAIPRRDYHQMLADAMQVQGQFEAAPDSGKLTGALEDLFRQSSSQTS
ncbi:Leucyl, phenylalanyl-tRNA-protein transferase [Magnetospira sp. QH-2]|nr:Leucyl, phenylalanyl-tRNA-protein transferase [Magnetospira sp. QH-2]